MLYDSSFMSIFNRGIVHCLKLSPNLRKQPKKIITAMLNKQTKKVKELQVQKLLVIVEMVKEPQDNMKEDIEEEYDPLK